jgi:hypothetical protein
MPSVMNRRMAASLGLCPHPATAAEGLKLFVQQPSAISSHVRNPAKPGKALPSMKSALPSKPSRFAHLAAAALGSQPARQADARRSASADATLAFVLNAGRRTKASVSAPSPALMPKSLATPAAAAAFVLGAGGSVRR